MSFDAATYRHDRQNRLAAERLDVLEAEMPRSCCSVRDCFRSAHYEHSSAFGHSFWLCSRHRPLYRKHDRMISFIRAL